jgi:hypothetical protein
MSRRRAVMACTANPGHCRLSTDAIKAGRTGVAVRWSDQARQVRIRSGYTGQLITICSSQRAIMTSFASYKRCCRSAEATCITLRASSAPRRCHQITTIRISATRACVLGGRNCSGRTVMSRGTQSVHRIHASNRARITGIAFNAAVSGGSQG